MGRRRRSETTRTRHSGPSLQYFVGQFKTPCLLSNGPLALSEANEGEGGERANLNLRRNATPQIVHPCERHLDCAEALRMSHLHSATDGSTA